MDYIKLVEDNPPYSPGEDYWLRLADLTGKKKSTIRKMVRNRFKAKGVNGAVKDLFKYCADSIDLSTEEGFIRRLHKEGKSTDAIVSQLHQKGAFQKVARHVLAAKVRDFVAVKRDSWQYGTEKITTNKNVADMHWREMITPIKAMQDMRDKISGSQSDPTWEIETDEPICVLILGDTQLGAWGTDYTLFEKITNEIIEIPNLYVILVGDLLQMSIKLRGVKEVNDILTPEHQIHFLDSWLADIQHKVICSTWDNHSVMREESLVGFSTYSRIFKKHTMYSNGIAHLDIKVNDQVYKGAISHFFRGRSMYNPCHAPARYIREMASDRDFAAQGDFHVPGVLKYIEGGRERIAIVCGSIQTDSGYAKRFFSLKTWPVFPCFTLDGNEKTMTPYWSVREWLRATGEIPQQQEQSP